jgi:hypothetical protein
MSLKLVDAEDVYRGKQKNQNSKSGANPDNEDYKRGYNSDSNNADDNIGGYNNDFGMDLQGRYERQAILDRIEKLFAHTGVGAVNINEMTVANKLMKELMEKYDVSIDEINRTKDKSKMVGEYNFTFFGKRRQWIKLLANMLAKFYECNCIMTKEGFQFIGFKNDAQISREMFDKLYRLIWKGSTREFGTKLRNDFCNGAVTGLHFKLNEISNAKIQTGLVLVKKKTVEDYVNQKYSRLTHEKTKTVRRSDAYYEGVTYGRTMDINSSIR